MLVKQFCPLALAVVEATVMAPVNRLKSFDVTTNFSDAYVCHSSGRSL